MQTEGSSKFVTRGLGSHACRFRGRVAASRTPPSPIAGGLTRSDPSSASKQYFRPMFRPELHEVTGPSTTSILWSCMKLRVPTLIFGERHDLRTCYFKQILNLKGEYPLGPHTGGWCVTKDRLSLRCRNARGHLPMYTRQRVYVCMCAPS